MQRLHESYKRHESLKKYQCYYCNSAADTADHVPALSIVESYPDYDRIFVRCCSLCNNILNNRGLLTLETRCEYLLIAYKKRWKKDLDMPLWSEIEILQLTGTLKKEIIIAMKRKERANRVILNLQNLKDIFDCCI